MKRRVLIVEDHPAIAQNIADFLDEDRFELDFAFDGLGGLHLALTQAYDVMVLDLGLPGMVGIAVCRRLRQPFVRGEEGEGTGIGLTLVDRIAARCGWQFGIQSEPASGTRAELHLCSPPKPDTNLHKQGAPP